ncbi:CMD domain-containing protein [Hydrogenophaga palleronii]|uniref:CMD domain-containing protein n=1 Tax=Hydrogenophaga palleronii TaxID=65655 RepID=UPI0009FFF5D5|nr:peroxidase-related enzyme [Hydrogenophaga palleronii]
MNNATNPVLEQDLIDAMASLAEGSPAHVLRHQRDKVVATASRSYEAFFGNSVSDEGPLSLQRRLAIALYACRLTPAEALSGHYRDRLLSCGADTAWVRLLESGAPADIAASTDAQLAAMLNFTRILVARPIEGDREELMKLPAVGLSTPQIVLLAQLVSFLSYQTRIVAGLLAMDADDGAPDTAITAAPDHAMLSNDMLRVSADVEANGFSNRMLLWRAWLDVVNLETATPEQIAVLEASHQSAKTADYYLTLAHCPDILDIRSAAFNAVMYAPRGLSRAERELCAVAASRVNGCVYCCSVHSRFFEQLAKRNDVIAQVYADPSTAGTSARERALIAFAIELTLTPQTINTASVRKLREGGLAPLEILDAIHATAMFGWANRLMLNLGEPYEAEPAA